MNPLESLNNESLLQQYAVNIGNHIVSEYEGTPSKVHLERANAFKEEFLKRDNADKNRIEKCHKELAAMYVKKSRMRKDELDAIIKKLK